MTNYKIATFAGGCFWCTQYDFADKPGIIKAVSGYAGGEMENPTYEKVHTGTTGHVEAVQITYDPKLVKYEDLLDIYWRSIDPTDTTGQFFDRGTQYKPVIFYHDEEQKQKVEKSKKELEKSKKFSKPITTEIKQYTNFHPAEEYHQDYAKKNPEQYQAYKKGSGRVAFRKKYWEE